MKTDMYIVSGFLGAGKTTLIQKLLQETFREGKIALVENDFGEVSVDAALLQAGGVQVTEINSGCICCTLSGDFIRALETLLTQYHPDTVIIEPSGVGKLSDIEESCSDPHIRALAEVKRKITVVDVKRCARYLDNFGEFFEDQIEHADTILLSRTEQHPDKAEEARALVKEHNAHAVVFSKPWADISGRDIVCPQTAPHRHEATHAEHAHDEACRHGGHEHEDHGGHVHTDHGEHEHEDHCGHAHTDHGGDAHEDHCGHVHTDHGGHEHEDHCGHVHTDHGGHTHEDHCGCEHDHEHTADAVFDTVTIRTNRVFEAADLRSRVSDMEKQSNGTILRAKGIVRGTDGYLNVQYLPGDWSIETCAAAGDMLCVIGQHLDGQALACLFDGAISV
jgi:G3E family GTPase